MNLFQLYADKAKHSELAELFDFASTQQQFGLAANFLEKDLLGHRSTTGASA